MKDKHTKTIVLASMLKPVDEPRMYQKLGLSLAQKASYDVNIIGFVSKNLPKNSRINFFPLFNFPRLSLQRLWAPFRFFKLLFLLKPDLLVVCTHELLIPALFYKLFKNVPIIYDVQENYFANIRYTDVYPVWIRKVLASYVRLKERFAYQWITLHFLAEKCYQDEMPWLKWNSLILENKYCTNKYKTEKPQLKTKKNPCHLLYSGTIGEHYGIFEAVEFAKKLHAIEPDTRLTIVGYAAQKRVLQKLKRTISETPFIQLIGGENPVAHEIIIREMEQAGFALLPYHFHKSTQNRIPTKFYEYAVHQLPMIVTDNPAWEPFIKTYYAGFTINFKDFSPYEILHKMKADYYRQNTAAEKLLWVTEEPKLMSTVKNIFRLT